MILIFNFLEVIFVTIVSCSNNKLENIINFDLVFRLKEFFQSDLILVATDEENHNFAKQFFRNNLTRGFTGAIDINKDIEISFNKKIISPYQNPVVVLDCNYVKRLAKSKITSELISSAIWIYFNESDFIKNLENLYIPFNCRFFIVNKINEFSYEIQNVYQISQNSLKIYSRFAEWKNNNLQVFMTNIYSKRMDLKGFELKLALSSFSEFRERFSYVWKLFSEKMNFTIKWMTPQLGKFYSNGTKTGLFKSIFDREIDGSPGNIVYSQSRLNVYDYIFPTIINEIRIYVKRSWKLNWKSYIAPFEKKVWLSIFFWVMLISFVKYLIIRFGKFYDFGYFEGSFFSVIKAIFNQAGTLNTRTTSLCILYVMPYFFALILTQYYSGALSSYLSVPQSNLPFSDFKGVLKDKTYKISIVNETFSLFYFTTNNGSIAVTVRENNLLVDTDKLPNNTIVGFRQLCHNRWIFLGPSFDLIIKEDCDIVELNDVIYKEVLGIIVWKGFPFKDVINKLMRKLQFAGLVKYRFKNRIFNPEGINTFKPFSMELVFPIFLLYFFSCSLSVLILLIEINWPKLREYRVCYVSVIMLPVIIVLILSERKSK